MVSDDVREYTESAASKGGLGRITGAMLMKTILGLVG
jgi:2,3-bisphosphoglycerate-independent phosphoglycerate mutase